MPFLFVLPTTSNLSYSAFISTNTHPSLPLKATSHRAVLRNVLKNHKRLAVQSRSADLSVVTAALKEYIPYLLALDASLSGKTINDEEVHLVLMKEIGAEWRTTLTRTVPGRDHPRLKVKGLEHEICFVLSSLAYAYSLQARTQLLALYGSQTPTAEQRTANVTNATRNFLEASSIHDYLASRSAETDASSAVIEMLSQTQSALGALGLAEATLLAVLKDDPYPAVVAQDRNKNDKDWMIKPPEIPKVRAHLFARLCLAAAEHAGKAEAMLSASGRIDEALMKYVCNLKATSRAKACRFFGIDAELGGETGKGIAWLLGGKEIFGVAVSADEGSKMKGLAKFKKDWTERREDKKIEKGGEWGTDAGRLEELRIIEMLEQKWNKLNNTINTQLIPPTDPLVSNMPSGRDIHSVKPYRPPTLDAETLALIRAPPERDELQGFVGDNDSSSDEDGKKSNGPPGAFPDASGMMSGNNDYY